MIVRWTAPALRQLRAAERYLLDHNPVAAHRIVGRIEAAAGRLCEMPYMGRPIWKRDARVLVVAATRYIIVYTLRHEDIVILALYHERQQRPTSPARSHG